MDELRWLEKWHLDNSNEDGYNVGIRIETLDNPGWLVKIDLFEMSFSNLHMDRIHFYNSENDWIDCQIKDSEFIGSGDCMKLAEIIEIFRKVCT